MSSPTIQEHTVCVVGPASALCTPAPFSSRKCERRERLRRGAASGACSYQESGTRVSSASNEDRDPRALQEPSH